MGRGPPPRQWRCSGISATPSLDLRSPGGAEHVGHVPVIPVGHCVVVGCDLVAHGGLPGVGAGGGQNYVEAPMASEVTGTGSWAQALLSKAVSLPTILITVATACH